MRFLADKNISVRLCDHLRAAGHDAVHVDHVGLYDAGDADLLEHARFDQRVVVSAFTDFGLLLAAQRSYGPSVLLTREISVAPAAVLADYFLAHLDLVAHDLRQGAIVAFGAHGIRVRRLPLG
ncbi:Predicted nuclease, contains PIN domain, potential toxin-antitoxin system component [Actinopolymorpha cephalotaxi]|uniref:Nuclease of putative toxin-antitoxin system n=1 Tax=Actinopolymorpha cephalotaxi TaxID=504797 RepID=A0A1I2NS25_9ACTN|nr:DUF5615 family PIN-like protein [Actinopolymorpha cephalotaxi]NYH85478.1 putative nuclease of putative toxin-antitoxin system [Actinopolymorpha cephalotaxi]SFG04071.1 Predicted nuclease, contains PIN domain, potential toxin-antitoxin system component [Actinopolymorpha cephalotaxi]